MDRLPPELVTLDPKRIRRRELEGTRCYEVTYNFGMPWGGICPLATIYHFPGRPRPFSVTYYGLGHVSTAAYSTRDRALAAIERFIERWSDTYREGTYRLV